MNRFGSFWYHDNQIVYDESPSQVFSSDMAGNVRNRYELIRDHTGTGKIIESMMGFLLKASPGRSGTGRLFLEF